MLLWSVYINSFNTKFNNMIVMAAAVALHRWKECDHFAYCMYLDMNGSILKFHRFDDILCALSHIHLKASYQFFFQIEWMRLAVASIYWLLNHWAILCGIWFIFSWKGWRKKKNKNIYTFNFNHIFGLCSFMWNVRYCIFIYK